MDLLSIQSVVTRRNSLDFALPNSYSSYIDGAYVDKSASSSDLPLVYPATGEQWASLSMADRAEVGAAVNSAGSSFRNGRWASMPLTTRKQILRAAGQKILDHAQELAELECLSTGLPLKHLLARQIPRAAENFFFFADYIATYSSDPVSSTRGHSTVVSRVPAGVTVGLGPWNASLAMASMQIASSTAFGNSCVIKPSEHSPAAVLRLAQLLSEAGMPDGVVNIICGGSDAGMALARHPGISRIAFTGKTANGRTVMAAAAGNLTPVQMGLSAKSANIVFADADLSRAVDGSVVNAFSNSGQICVAGSRILVEEGISKQFIEAFLKRVSRLRIGDPMDQATDIGPLGYREHCNRVREYIQVARDSGADLLVGGDSSNEATDGCFVQPTVALVNDNQLRICQEEIFGPFVTIQTFKTEDQAIRICNESRYGLLAYLWTTDGKRITRLQQAIQVGTVFVNTSLVRDLNAPFGGVKASGIGREGPRECADFYTEAKTVITSV